MGIGKDGILEIQKYCLNPSTNAIGTINYYALDDAGFTFTKSEDGYYVMSGMTWFSDASGNRIKDANGNSGSYVVDVVPAGAQSGGDVQQASFVDGDISLKDVVNYGLGLTGLVINSTVAKMQLRRNALAAGKFSKSALREINLIDKSVGMLNKTSQRLGIAGLFIVGGVAYYDYQWGDGVTASQAFDFGVGVVLTAATITNPALLVGFGVYGALDALGTFDGIKSGLGGNTIILKRH